MPVNLKKNNKKNLFLLFFGFQIFLSTTAQISKIPDTNIESGIEIIAPYLEESITEHVRLVGAGEFQELLKEPLKLNIALTAYLISKKKFNTIVLSIPDWKIRKLNNYLINDNFSKYNFNSVFKESFYKTSYYTQEFKDFLLWLRNYNLTNQSQVKICGGSSVIGAPAEFPKMNDYFIETYIRPFNAIIADSMKVNWSKVGNSNSRSSDSIVLSFINSYIRIVELNNILSQDLLEQLKMDYGHRMAAFRILNSNLSENNKLGNMYIQNSIVEADRIETLLKEENIRIVLMTTNSNVVNQRLYAISRLHNQRLPLPRNGALYKSKYGNSYFSTVTAFTDSAHVTGTKGNLRFQPITIYGNTNAKSLIAKKEVYYFVNDSVLLGNYALPFVNNGMFGGDDVIIIAEDIEDKVPFDILFFFKSFSRVSVFPN